MSKHIIHKQQVVLQIPRQEEAFSFQDRVSGLFRNGLQAAVENVLDEISLQNEVIKIDTLKIDLGIINAQNFEKEFEGKFLTALKTAVLTGKGKTAGEGKATVTAYATSQREAFIYFLQHGVLPWYSNAKNIREWEIEIIGQWQQADWVFILQWIKENQSSHSQILQRLVAQFPDNFLEQFITKAITETGLASSTINSWHQLYSDVYYILKIISSQKHTVLRKEIWTDVFLLYFQGNSENNIKFFFTQLLTRQLSYSDAAVSNIIAFKDELLRHIKTTAVQHVLSNIIADIESEQTPGRLNDPAVTGKANGKKHDKLYAAEDAGNEERQASSAKDNENSVPKKAAPAGVKPRPKKNEPSAKENVLYVTNCGLVLLHPFLQAYFTDLGLTEDKHFINQQAQQRAVLLLYYLATGETEAAEFNLVLQKTMCGYSLEETLDTSIELLAKEAEESEKLLRTVVDYWPPLKNTSPQGFQSTFLQRQGKLSLIQSGWLLQVEQKAVDVLLGKLPWGFSTVRLPWMQDIINVEWC